MPITGAPPDVPVAVRVYKSIPQLIPNVVWTDIIFDNQRWDDPNDDQWTVAPNPTRLTCRFADPYIITGNIRWRISNLGFRILRIFLNGITMIAMVMLDPVIDEISVHIITTTYKLAVGDFVELGVYQNSGGALNVDSAAQYSPEFSMVRGR